MMRRPRLTQRDWLIVALTAALLAIGAAFVRSASYRSGPMGEGYYTTSPLKQLQWAAIGVVLFAGVLFVNYRHLIEHGYALYAVGLGALVLVLFLGVRSPAIQARRWFAFGSMRVQPSEFMKLVMIVTLARYLTHRESHRRFLGLLPPFAIVLVPMALVAIEPDLGTALVLLPVVFAMLYAAAARAGHLWLIVVMGLACLPVAWVGMRPYQKERVLSFLYQEDPRRQYDSYQLRQAKIAIGSGGLFGKGWEKGTHQRLNYIPAKTRNNDFIFAVICEELGFFGACLVFALYLALFASCLRTAEEVHHPGGRLIAVGVVTMVGTEAVVNAAMATGQLPVVGLSLPLISYGGSSLLSSLLGLALVVNVSIYRGVALAADELDPEAAARRASAPLPEESFMHE